MNEELLSTGRHRFTVNGIELAYEVRGRGPAVLVHSGGPGIDSSYLRMPELEQDATLIYLDPVGTGRSDLLPGGDYTVEVYAGLARATIHRLGLSRPCFLGHSHGGFVGQELAIRSPGLLGSLILYSSAPMSGPELVEEAGRQMIRFAERWPDREESQHAADVWARARTGTVTPPRDQKDFLRFYSDILPAYFADYRETVAERGPLQLAGTHDPARRGRPWDVRGDLQTITLPTLVISGTYDFICSERWADELASSIPGATHLRLHNSGHFAHLESERDQFFTAVTRFLASAHHDRNHS